MTTEEPTSISPESRVADDALLALERQFEVIAREFAILLRKEADQNEERRGGHRDVGPANQRPPSEQSCEPADKTDKPYAERLERLEAALARLEPIERAIMATPAQTVAGLGVKARHAAYVISEYWAEPQEKIDWDRRAAAKVIRGRAPGHSRDHRPAAPSLPATVRPESAFGDC